MEIKSCEDLEKWLKGAPAWWAAAIAQRAALRVLPLALFPADWGRTEKLAALALAFFRAQSISAFVVTLPTIDVLGIAPSIYSAAFAASVIAGDDEVYAYAYAGVAAAASNAAFASAKAEESDVSTYAAAASSSAIDGASHWDAIYQDVKALYGGLACCLFDGHQDKVFYRTGGLLWSEGSTAASLSLRR